MFLFRTQIKTQNIFCKFGFCLPTHPTQSMKTPIFILIVLMSFFNLNAQDAANRFQEFQNKIDQTQQNDTILYYLNLQAALLKSSADYVKRGNVEIELGLHSKYDGFSSEKHYRAAQNYFLMAGDSSAYLNSLYLISTAKRNQNDHKTSILYLDSVIAMARNFDDSDDRLLKAYATKADAYMHMSDHVKALETLNKSKKIAFSKEDDQKALMNIYATESHILLTLKSYERAIDLVHQIIDYHKKKDNIRKLVMWSNNLAKVYDACRCGEFKDRENLLKQSISYADEIQFFYGKAYALMHIARLYMEFDDLKKSHTYLRKVEKLLPKVNKKDFTMWFYEVYGRFWELKKEYKKSITYEKKVLQLNEELENPYGQGLSSQKLAQLYIKLNDYKNAYTYREQSRFFEDSLNSKEKVARYKELEMTAAFEKQNYVDSLQIAKENELIAIKHEQELSKEKQTRTLLYVVLAVIALGALGFYFAYRKKKEQTALLDAKNKQIAEALEEKQLLLKEIHHRVKNNFQVVSSLLELQTQGVEDEKALEMAREGQNRVKAMALIHEKLYKNESGTIDFDEFIRLLVKELSGLYEDLEKVNVEVNSRGMKFDLDTAIPLGLIVNELITNSFKYAFSKDKTNELSVSIDRADTEHYRLVVSDNGPGVFLNTEIRKIKSLGLFLVYRLSRQLKGKIELSNEGGARFDLLFKHINARHSID